MCKSKNGRKRESDLFAPELDLLLLKVAAVLLVQEHQIYNVLCAHAIIDVFIAGGQIRRRQVESHWHNFALHWGSVHQFELGERLVLGDRLRPIADSLPANQAELHLANLDAYQVEVNFALNTVFEVELAILKLELYVQTVFNAYLHLDGRVLNWLLLQILNDEFFLLRHLGVLAVDRHVDVISDAHHDAVVRLELLL